MNEWILCVPVSFISYYYFFKVHLQLGVVGTFFTDKCLHDDGKHKNTKLNLRHDQIKIHVAYIHFHIFLAAVKTWPPFCRSTHRSRAGGVGRRSKSKINYSFYFLFNGKNSTQLFQLFTLHAKQQQQRQIDKKNHSHIYLLPLNFFLHFSHDRYCKLEAKKHSTRNSFRKNIFNC